MKLLTVAVGCGLVGVIFFVFAPMIAEGSAFWAMLTAAGVAMAACGIMLNGARGVAAKLDRYMQLTDDQILAIQNMLRRMDDPSWAARKIKAAYPQIGNFLNDLEEDKSHLAYRVKKGLYSDTFISAYTAGPFGSEPDSETVCAHEDA